MTIVELKSEAQDWAKEYWWNGAGVAVVGFLIAVFIWKRPDNDYLLYFALLTVCVHAWVSNLTFVRKRTERQHRTEIAVAYREHLILVQKLETSYGLEERPIGGRNGVAAHRLARPPVRLIPVAPL